MTYAWFAFRAYNTQTQYGYGTLAEAEAYTDHLNRDREINVYAPVALTTEQVNDLGLDDSDLGVNLADALADI